DLNSDGVSKIGTGNTIWLTASQKVDQLANLPATWDPSNKIYLNGVLQDGSGASQVMATPATPPTLFTPVRSVPFDMSAALSRVGTSNSKNPAVNNISPGVLNVSEGVTQVDQHIIPRFGNGTDGAAGQIVGSGINSILTGTANTQNQTLKAVV